MQSDSIFNKILPYTTTLSKFISLSINSFLILKANSNFGEYVLNYVRIDTLNTNLISVSENKNKKFLLIIINYLIPFIAEIILKLINKKVIKLSNELKEKFFKIMKTLKILKIFVDLAFKLSYIFRNKLLYSDLVDYLLKIMIVNQGSKESFSDKFLNIGKQINLFFIYMLFRLGEWYYSKDNKIEVVNEIDPPNSNCKEIKKCPICLKQFEYNKNIIALRCCGYVFCESCINTHMDSDFLPKCPTCENSLNNQHLVKIYQ